MCNRDIYYVSEVKDQTIPLDSLMKGVAATLPDSVQITGVTISDNPERAYKVNLSKPHRAALFVDQYNGNITGTYERGAFFKNMFFLHRWLLDGGNPKEGGVFHGKLIVGISTLVFVIVLITGILIWLYRARKAFKRSLKISVRNGWTIFWKNLHVAGGMYIVIFLLAMALTGLTWSFDWYRTGFYKVFGVEQTAFHGGGESHGGGHGHGEGHGKGRGDRHGESHGFGKDHGHDGENHGDWHGKHEGQHEGRHGKPELAKTATDRTNPADRTNKAEAKRQHEDVAPLNEPKQAESEMEEAADGTTGASEQKGHWEHMDGEQHHRGDGEHPHHGDGARYHHHDAEVAANDSSTASSESTTAAEAKPEKNNWKKDNWEKGKRSGKPEFAKADETAAHHNKADKAEGTEGKENAGKPEEIRHADGGTGASRQTYGDAWTSFENWQTAYDAVKAQNVNAPSITVSEGKVEVSLGNYGNNRAADSYSFDSQTGKITGEQSYADNAAGDKMRGWIYAVHTGAWAGIIGRILAFLAALLGASLPLTGYYIWIKRLRSKRR
jgi:uncharacterized iron-regulated membrane protein